MICVENDLTVIVVSYMYFCLQIPDYIQEVPGVTEQQG